MDVETIMEIPVINWNLISPDRSNVPNTHNIIVIIIISQYARDVRIILTRLRTAHVYVRNLTVFTWVLYKPIQSLGRV